MRDQSVAARYAEALFEVAQSQGRLDPVDQDLAGIAQLLRENHELAAFWENPVVATADKQQVLRQLLTEQVQPITLNTLFLMFDHKRGHLIPALQEAFRERYDQARRRTRVHVISAMPLDEATADQLRQQLERSTAREVQMDTAVDPELIGGLVVTMGDQVIDSSLRGRLENMARALA